MRLLPLCSRATLDKEPVEVARQSETIEKIREEVSRRLRGVCGDFPEEQFETLVRDVARTEFLQGFSGRDRVTRRQLFDACYADLN